MTRPGAGALLALVLGAAAPVVRAQAPEPPAFTPKGADTCLKCHDEDSKFPVVDIFKKFPTTPVA